MLDFINQNGPIKFFVAFAIVLALIALTAWLVRRFSANRLGGSSRGRQPRLAVIDAASVDGRRRLVLIRRDNVEHLMMIGGPNDLVVEPNIVRATAARDAGRDAYRPTPPEARQETRPEARQEARPAPLGDSNGSWPLQPSVEPPPAAPVQPAAPRNYRASVTDEPWVAPEPPAPPPAPPGREPSLRARPADSVTGSITGMAAEFNARLNPEFEVPSPPRSAPVREPAAAAPPPPSAPPPLPPHTDRNLAEMAQRLEAALRRPSAQDDIRPPVTDPLAGSVSTKEPPPLEARVEPKMDVAPEPKSESKPESKKNPFDSLEEEMASLLGRQPGKT